MNGVGRGGGGSRSFRRPATLQQNLTARFSQRPFGAGQDQQNADGEVLSLVSENVAGSGETSGCLFSVVCGDRR
jgi:hypothetical protein